MPIKEVKINTEKIVRQAYEAAAELKAIDPLILDLRNCCSFTDYFLICSAASSQQLRALANNIERRLKEHGVRHYGHCEGEREARWLLLDYGDFIVHILLEEARHFYNLEQLWSQAPQVEVGEKR